MSSKPTPSSCTRLIPTCPISKLLAADLGVSRGAIKTWVFQARKAAGKVPTSTADHPETPEDELARLRVENDSLRADKRALRSDVERLEEERTILRKATKYFAAETTW